MRKLKREIWPYCTSSHVTKVNGTSIIPNASSKENWLHANLGQFKVRWNIVENYSQIDYYFKDPEDMMMFKLIWP